MQKLQIAYFCGFLRIFADYLRTFAFFLRTFCLWFGACGDQHTAMFTIRRKKLHVFLSLGAGRWDHAWIVGRMSRNNIFCVAKKMQNMLVSLIHGTEFIDLTLNVVPQAILITHVYMTKKVLAPLDFWTFDPNVPIWHVYKICAQFVQICVQSSNRTVFLVLLKVQAGNFEQFIAHIFSPTDFFLSFARGFHPL